MERCNCFCVIEESEIILQVESDGGSIPAYHGDYTVIPKAWVSQELETQNLKMNHNVTVTEVPYAEVPNDSGTTVTIAS